MELNIWCEKFNLKANNHRQNEFNAFNLILFYLYFLVDVDFSA